MNPPIRHVAIVASLLFALLLGATSWTSAIDARAINEKPNNRRTILASYDKERGKILVGGKVVVRSVPTKDEIRWKRVYTEPELYATVTGYNSFVYGNGAGLESAADPLLSGKADQLFYGRVTDALTGKRNRGASLSLTIRPKMQQAAREGLGNQKGAVVALDPKTGAILAMYSNPTYDPNTLSTHDLSSAQDAWERLTTDADQPMLNRAISRTYPPGSTFKVVTSAAALEGGTYSKDSQIPGPAVLKLPQTTSTIANSHPGPCGPSGTVSLLAALEQSCNTAYGWLGMKIGADGLRDTAGAFGFGQEMSIPMAVAPSRFPDEVDPPGLAKSAIGQQDVAATPMEMAMVAAAVGNKGTVMKPYLVRSVRGSDLSVIDETKPDELGRAMDEGAASQLGEMMTAVVRSGTGGPAGIPGVSVAGKTGTAQHAPGKPPHAWFIGYAPAEDPKVAVAVVVESGGNAGSEAYGGTVAGPISKKVMEAAL